MISTCGIDGCEYHDRCLPGEPGEDHGLYLADEAPSGYRALPSDAWVLQTSTATALPAPPTILAAAQAEPTPQGAEPTLPAREGEVPALFLSAGGCQVLRLDDAEAPAFHFGETVPKSQGTPAVAPEGSSVAHCLADQSSSTGVAQLVELSAVVGGAAETVGSVEGSSPSASVPSAGVPEKSAEGFEPAGGLPVQPAAPAALPPKRRNRRPTPRCAKGHVSRWEKGGDGTAICTVCKVVFRPVTGAGVAAQGASE